MEMANIEIYTKPTCPYCLKAKTLLNSKGVSYKEINISENERFREEMINRSNRKTVPQIFIDGKSIGGCDDLHELENQGELDELLNN
jgi:glutaredoxin 3